MTLPVSNPDLDSFDNDPEIRGVHEAMVKAGEPIEDQTFVDYFAEPVPQKWYLPDGKQFFMYVELREGGKALYEKATNKDIRVQRSTGDARLAVDPATARQVLVKLSVIDAQLYQRNTAGNVEPIPFVNSPKGKDIFWERVFDRFPADIIDKLHKELVKANPWMAADDDIKALKEQRDELNDRIERAEEEQAKKSSS